LPAGCCCWAPAFVRVVPHKRPELGVAVIRDFVGTHRRPRDEWRRRPSGREIDLVATPVARALGISRRAVEVTLWGPLNLAQRCARVITALKAAGADEALVQFIQPIDLAISRAQAAVVRDDGQLTANARGTENDVKNGVRGHVGDGSHSVCTG